MVKDGVEVTFDSLKGERAVDVERRAEHYRQGNIESKGLRFTIFGELGKGQGGWSEEREQSG